MIMISENIGSGLGCVGFEDVRIDIGGGRIGRSVRFQLGNVKMQSSDKAGDTALDDCHALDHVVVEKN